MTRNNRTARWEYLKIVAVGVVLLGTSACISVPGSGSSQSKSFSFVQLCDPQLGMGGYEHDVGTLEQAVTQINALHPAFVVICGDLVGKPTTNSVADFNRIRAALDVPSHCVPGNHDVGNQPTAESLRSYREAFGEDYYSFEHKGCVFVCVNTQLWKSPVAGETEAQDRWLEAALEAASRKGARVFIVGHHPLFGKTPGEPTGYYNLPVAKRMSLLDLYEKHGVVAVLSGHAHKRIINDYNGIQLVTGETTSKTHGSPLGFRLWHITDIRPFKHEAVALEGL